MTLYDLLKVKDWSEPSFVEQILMLQLSGLEKLLGSPDTVVDDILRGSVLAIYPNKHYQISAEVSPDSCEIFIDIGMGKVPKSLNSQPHVVMRSDTEISVHRSLENGALPSGPAYLRMDSEYNILDQRWFRHWDLAWIQKNRLELWRIAYIASLHGHPSVVDGNFITPIVKTLDFNIPYLALKNQPMDERNYARILADVGYIMYGTKHTLGVI